jgi:MraZ protein
VFLSTFEKQLDAKRRIVLPAEFRALVAGPFDGGGQSLFESYRKVIDELPFGDPLRTALETMVLAGMAKMSFDPAGRITLPETLCEQFDLSDSVTVVGMGDRFQIWSREAFKAHWARQRDVAREGLAAYRTQQRQARAGALA